MGREISMQDDLARSLKGFQSKLPNLRLRRADWGGKKGKIVFTGLQGREITSKKRPGIGGGKKGIQIPPPKRGGIN